MISSLLSRSSKPHYEKLFVVTIKRVGCFARVGQGNRFVRIKKKTVNSNNYLD